MPVLYALAEDIRERRIGTGERIPSGAALYERFGVARETARRAVRELRERGMVYTEWGKGSIVADRPEGAEGGQGEG
ncbi:GntR family transcriptional regulator [Streptomyces sp. NPDC001889]